MPDPALPPAAVHRFRRSDQATESAPDFVLVSLFFSAGFESGVDVPAGLLAGVLDAVVERLSLR